MILNMNGGGASLNFKVIGGTTAPSNPKENTIWVNTDMEITSWIFSATQPESPAAGMVWITTGTGSPVAFNALKKNNIQVYPISAKQYVDGAWVDKTAKSYQTGEWVEWITYIYKNGDLCESVTGGYSQVTYSSYWTSGTVNFNADHIEFKTNNKNISQIKTKNLIDLTNVNKVSIRVDSYTATGTQYATASLYVSESDADNAAAKKQFKYTDITDIGVISIDTSGLTGSYYIGFGCSSDGGYTSNMKVSEAWME